MKKIYLTKKLKLIYHYSVKFLTGKLKKLQMIFVILKCLKVLVKNILHYKAKIYSIFNIQYSIFDYKEFLILTKNFTTNNHNLLIIKRKI